MTKSSVEKYYLPEVSSLLALYLRQSTGDQHIFARVILPTDKDSNDPDRPYISIGICVHGCEDEQFVLSPPDKGTDWSLTGIYACALVTPLAGDHSREDGRDHLQGSADRHTFIVPVRPLRIVEWCAMTLKEIQTQIRELRREMRENGIRRTSCFNGGLDRETYRYNARMFELQTRLHEFKRKTAKNA